MIVQLLTKIQISDLDLLRAETDVEIRIGISCGLLVPHQVSLGH